MNPFLKTLASAALTLILASAGLMLAQQRSAEAALRAAIETEMTRGASAAIEQYKRVADTYRRSDPAVAAQALLRLAQAYEKLGDPRSRETFEQILRDFVSQKDVVALARTRLGALGDGTAEIRERAVWTGPKVDPVARVSPDGRSLIAKAEDIKNEGVFQIDVESGRTTFIVPTGGGSFPRWAADSSKIYYLKRGPQPQILERDLRTGIEREVFSPASLPHDIEVSPDGRHLAVRTGIDPASSTSSIWIMPVPGGAPRELVRVPAAAAFQNPWSQIAWTPDGRALLTVRRSGAAVELWLLEIETGNPRKLNIDVSEWTLSESQGPGSGFALSPDGQSIAFLMGKSNSEVWALENFLSALK
jgi:Tol biopolymer transport system component